jgi:hypothetical protein
MTILRWVLVLPGALLAPIILVLVLDLCMGLLSLTDTRWSFSFEKGFLGLIVEYFIVGTIFVFSGSLIAPGSRKTVATLLASLFYLLLFVQIIVILFFREAVVSLSPIAYGFAGALGATSALRTILRNPNRGIRDWYELLRN